MSPQTLEREPAETTRSSPNPASQSTGKVEFLVVRDVRELARYAAPWDDLAAASCEANVFYESWFLLPAVELFGAEHQLEFHLVFESGRGPQSVSPQLIGFFPFERHRYKGLPATVLSLWKHMYSMLGTPLVRKGHEREALKAMLDHARSMPNAPALIEWQYLVSNGTVAQILNEILRESRTATFIDDAWERALLSTRHGKTGEEYIHDVLGRRRRKELKRQANRLEEAGAVELRSLDPESVDGGDFSIDLDSWTTEFLRLEASGWKGEAGSAFLSKPTHEQFFRTIVREAYGRKRLRMLELRLNDQPIAASCDFLAGDGDFAFKIAYDEAYSRYSPGVQLEIENIQRLHARPEVSWMDSCAVRDHPMINRLCADRRPLQNLVIAARPQGTLVIKALPRIRAIKAKLRPAPQTAAAPNETEEHND